MAITTCNCFMKIFISLLTLCFWFKSGLQGVCGNCGSIQIKHTPSQRLHAGVRLFVFCPAGSKGSLTNFVRGSRIDSLRGGGEVKAIDTQLQELMDIITAKADLVLEPKAASVSAINTSLRTASIAGLARKVGEELKSSSAINSSLRTVSRQNRNVAGLLRTTSEELIGLMNTFESRLERLKLWKVRFKRYAKVQYGQALYVCGDSAVLGDGDPSKAVRMKHLGENLWEIVVADIPEGTKFRYLIKSHEEQWGRADVVQWVTSYPMQLSSRMEDCFLENGLLVQDNTQQAVRFKMNKAGVEQVCVVGSIPQLGSWDYDRALKLENSHGNTWEKVVLLRSDQLADFEYKFFTEPGRVVESGPNRISDAHLVEPQQELGASGELTDLRIVNLECVWEGLLVRFLIFHPLDKPSSYLAVSGSHEAMGGWLGKPLRMGLGNERTLLTNVQGRCWEATFAATAHDVARVEYRYCIVDGASQTAIFEREPNRRLPVIPGSESSARIAAPTLGVGTPARERGGHRQREWQTYDGNFVPPDLSFDDVPPCLAIGPYPQVLPPPGSCRRRDRRHCSGRRRGAWEARALQRLSQSESDPSRPLRVALSESLFPSRSFRVATEQHMHACLCQGVCRRCAGPPGLGCVSATLDGPEHVRRRWHGPFSGGGGKGRGKGRRIWTSLGRLRGGWAGRARKGARGRGGTWPRDGGAGA